jgi:hypothetical protein
MRPLRVRTLIIVLLLGALVTHLAWSTAVAIAFSRYQRRIVDVRRWPGPVSVPTVTEMVSMYFTHELPPSSSPSTVFVGSSVAYGYPWAEELAVSSRYAELRPGEHVVNASVIGADTAFLDDAILCGATNAKVRADILIVELPVINSVNGLKRRAGINGPPCDETIGRVGILSFVIKHPRGTGWLSFLWDDKALSGPEQTIAPKQRFFGFFLEPDDYARFDADFQREVITVLNRAKTVGRRVYAFPSPVFVPGVTEIGFNRGSVEAQLQAALTACRQVADVQCLDAAPFYVRRELFMNLTHLNQRGQQALAEWLAGAVARP